MTSQKGVLRGGDHVAQLYCFTPDSKVHGVHLGPVGPRWVPCRPHESCYQGRVILVRKPPWLGLGCWSIIKWPLDSGSVSRDHAGTLIHISGVHINMENLSEILLKLKSPKSCLSMVAFWTHWGLVTPFGVRSRSTLAQVIACCLTAPSHYLN